MLRVSLIILIFGLHLAPSSAKPNFQLSVVGLTCHHEIPQLIETFECRLIAVKSKNLMFGSVYLKQAIDKLKVHFILDYSSRNGKKSTKIMDIYSNGCEFFALIHKNNLLKIADDMLKKFANQELRCPFTAHNNYTIQNAEILDDGLPSIFPEGLFHANISGFLQGSKVAKAFVNLQIRVAASHRISKKTG